MDRVGELVTESLTNPRTSKAPQTLCGAFHFSFPLQKSAQAAEPERSVMDDAKEEVASALWRI